MREDAIKDRIMLAVSQLGVKIFTNPVGNFWAGKFIKMDKGVAWIAHAHRVFCGLFKGSHDLIGWKAVKITPAMVGMTLPVFVGIEVKQPGEKRTPEQMHFDNTLRKDGGLCGVATSAEEAIAIVTRLDNVA